MHPITRFLKECLFPRWCCGCNSYGELLCPTCFSKIEFNTEAKLSTEHLQSLSALVSFEPTATSIVHQLKYQSVKEIAILCARMMFMYGTIPTAKIITSVPLHKYRQNQRGFNQAEEIAQELASLMRVTYQPLLRRIKHEKNLASILDIELRKKTIADQFALLGNVTEKNILIIDDVWTTGATLEEVAKVLKSHGAHQVYGYTFAHGL